MRTVRVRAGQWVAMFRCARHHPMDLRSAYLFSAGLIAGGSVVTAAVSAVIVGDWVTVCIAVFLAPGVFLVPVDTALDRWATQARLASALQQRAGHQHDHDQDHQRQ